jgi:hypothetical protein
MRFKLRFVILFLLLAMVAPAFGCACFFNYGLPHNAKPNDYATEKCCDSVTGSDTALRGWYKDGDCFAENISQGLREFQTCCYSLVLGGKEPKYRGQ